MRQKFIAGNWKMNKTPEECRNFAQEFKNIYTAGDVRVAFAVPYLDLVAAQISFKDTGIEIGAQNMHWEESGAYTGEVSGEMLKAIGVDLCIIGHSERRQYFGETDETVNKKLKKAVTLGITPILCVGESLATREAGEEKHFVMQQLIKDFEGIKADDAKGIVIAYEPIWAIGTGKTATSAQAQEMCAYIRNVINELYGQAVSESVIIQYGGSVKASNAAELMGMPDIDGALVGGASLKPADFLGIIQYK